MEVLSKTLKEASGSKNVASSHNASLNIDFEKTWRFNASEEDEKRKARKVWSKQQALLMASKVDRKLVNEMLLKEQDVFVDTPKYLAVTKRLYRPFANQYNYSKLDESTQEDTESIVDGSTEWGGPQTKYVRNRHRWKLQTSPLQTHNGENRRGNFLSLDPPSSRP